MIINDLRTSTGPSSILHGDQKDVEQLWTALRLAQPDIAKTRKIVKRISDYFAKLVIGSIYEASSHKELVALIVLRGGISFLDSLCAEIPNIQLGFILLQERKDVIYAEMPFRENAHLVVFDLVTNTGGTIERVLQFIQNTTKQMRLPEPLTLHVATPFSTSASCSRFSEDCPRVIQHTMWNGLYKTSNGRLLCIDFDAGDFAFGVEPRVNMVLGECIISDQSVVQLHSNTKIAGLIRNGKRILVVRKNVPDRVEWIIPGGKPMPGESQEDTLRRELLEELQVSVSGINWFGWFEGVATFEGTPIAMDVYDVQIHGMPKASSEIIEVRWIGQDYYDKGVILGNLLEEAIVPALKRSGIF